MTTPPENATPPQSASPSQHPARSGAAPAASASTGPADPLFGTVLVANRGEIACRVIRTLDRLGIASVAVYSDADAAAPHVRAATRAVRIGPASAAESYLNIDAVIDAARATGAEAIHPGYGFLSENAAFARACEDAGIVFLGPGPEALETMGDKITAKAAVARRGVPLVPGIAEPGLSDEQLVAAAGQIGFPVLVKPSAGGGGKGMRAVHDPAELPAALASARREAAASFGDDTLFLERLVATPRHIEVQVIADAHGAVVHAGERECSLQRRHQKVIEEAPSPLIDPATRARLGEAACETARSVGYRGVGTVEFIVSADAPEEFFFMEMNTRLQVEHPVTEEITGIDLVEQQLRIGAGEPLALDQEAIDARLATGGHAVEARVYAEDPSRGFLPTGGELLDAVLPAGEGIRVDSGIAAGQRIGTEYDPMLAKVIAHGSDRVQALSRLERALAETALPGVVANTGFLRLLLAREDVRAGDMDTDLIDRLTAEADPQQLAQPVTEEHWRAAAVALARSELDQAARDDQGPPSPWAVPDGWLVSGRRDTVITLSRAAGSGADQGEETREIVLPAAALAAGDGSAPSAEFRTWVRRIPGAVQATVWVGNAAFERRGAQTSLEPGAAGQRITAPMPGTVIDVRAADGDEVSAGQPVIVLEAMKMEHVLTSPGDGVLRLATHTGAQVAVDEELAAVLPPEDSAADNPGPGTPGSDSPGSGDRGAGGPAQEQPPAGEGGSAAAGGLRSGQSRPGHSWIGQPRIGRPRGRRPGAGTATGR
ncbi:acetyl/propionyl/methylcrotonyl-CoA carboxylase subunit alpha [Sediminivirga luteola]|nr:biotin carboxylase N-terminal domain-containing protein [Sediminivirga luteola]MCI2266140.1 ATP-grasp domain-containing protein [Sediminivirga luteola]